MLHSQQIKFFLQQNSGVLHHLFVNNGFIRKLTLMKRKYEILIHAGFWIFYIAQSAITYPSDYIDKYGFWNIAFKQATGVLSNLIPFYVNYLFLIPKLLSKLKYMQFIIAEVILLAAGIGIKILQANMLDWYFSADDFFISDMMQYLPYYSANIFFFMILSIGAKFSFDWFRNQKIREEIEKEKAESELAMLKYQISPHFLFNTLNNIYSLVQRKSPKAGDAVLKLSELMRYFLKDENGKHKISMEKEIEYINNFIDLQRMRLDNPGIVSFSTAGNFKDKKIEPMLLIPFIENAFKHGKINDEAAKIQIGLLCKDNTIDFMIVNGKRSSQTEKTQGIGIKNTKRRLELLYPGKYSLEIDDNEKEYRVQLSVELI